MCTTTVVNHLVYDAFGRVTSESNPAVDSLFLFTARPFDADTGLQNNLHRWYDPVVGRWMSEDPVGFQAEGANLYRYCGNNPVVHVDSTGMYFPPPGGWFPIPLNPIWPILGPVLPQAGRPFGDASGVSRPLPPLGPLTADEKALFRFCDKLDYSRCRSGCTKDLCNQAVEKFIRAVHSTWIVNIFGWPLGPNTCKRWTKACDKNFGDLETTNPCVSRSQVCLQSASAFLGAANIHATFIVGLCGQFRLEADNGAHGGEDHIIPTW